MIRTRGWGRASRGVSWVWRCFVFALPGFWVLGVVAWELFRPSGAQAVQLLAAAPAIACAGSGRRPCVVLGGVCAALALIPLSAVEPENSIGPRVGTCCAILAVVAASYLTTGRRIRLLRELERSREVATAAQQVLLRPLPPRLAGLTVAAGHLSATRAALVGGDLYEALATRHGVRIVIGDVRGHGLAAIGAVAALLGSFRDAAHDEPELPGVLRRLDRAMERHLRERAERPGADEADQDSRLAEEFVTVLLLEVSEHGGVTALNCGHPWPYLLTRSAAGRVRAVRLGGCEPLPPLGPFPLPTELPELHWPWMGPGDTLVVHTDGAEDARDASGNFFPLHHALVAAAEGGGAGGTDGASGIVPRSVVDGVHAALLRHSGGRLTDDVALMVLRNDRDRVPAASTAASVADAEAVP
ncbi:PP2C family protein-serine/threonine phosphatase [Streptomyces sp. 8N706]|uniref:PP2C family protein-serine/threonine phosphatase n=1 Tax=Streptomyces sp. 8N706 TaxID=3457416 RepID=UPI003FD5ED4C